MEGGGSLKGELIYEIIIHKGYVLTLNSKETLLLDGSVEDYEYLNKSRREVDGIDDREEWSLLKVTLSAQCFIQLPKPYLERFGRCWFYRCRTTGPVPHCCRRFAHREYHHHVHTCRRRDNA